jgi:hypothetical protein
MSLKVFDLQCAQGHVFEGWFGSHADFDSQHSRGLITCPMCGNGVIEKKLSARKAARQRRLPCRRSSCSICAR